MNILILNWRDIKNPKSGGAEKLNMEILKPLIERGDTIFWYSMAHKSLRMTEEIDGVRIIRSGNALTHYLRWPFLLWTGKFGKVDIIIDAIHGTGYLSSIFAPRTKKIILICEVAQNIWDEMYSFPVNVIGKMWEKVMFKFYKKEIFWTISNSTKKDLVSFGIKEKKIEVLPMGFDWMDVGLQKKYKEASALFVGRLAEMKGIKDAIKTISEVNKSANEKWYLRIIGRGTEDYELALRQLVKASEQENFITFLGYVSERVKYEEMAKAWILIVPSSREGWGMIVPEANSVGTAVVGYNVSGLCDVMHAYAKENILISPSINSLTKTLKEINTPSIVKNRPRAGWSNLYDFVKIKLPKDANY